MTTDTMKIYKDILNLSEGMVCDLIRSYMTNVENLVLSSPQETGYKYAISDSIEANMVHIWKSEYRDKNWSYEDFISVYALGDTPEERYLYYLKYENNE